MKLFSYNFFLILFLIGSSSSMALEIVTIEQPKYCEVLKNPANEVIFPLSQEEIQLIADMKVKLKNLGGVGLAAPQVNFSKKIIAVYIPEEARLLRDNVERIYPMHVLINPSYKPLKGALVEYDFEGCYSVSTKAGKVPRFSQINITYYNEVGHYVERTAHGFYARVLQHEIDHLNGILISDRLTPDCVQGTLEEMMALRRSELPEEKRALLDRLVAKKQKK